MKNKHRINKIAVIILCFFLLNLVWVFQDNRLPFTGDDSRWLFETNRLAVTLKQVDIAGFATRWQNMFITETNSFPRTPLFTLLSVPTFMLFGPSTDAAVVTNLLVFAACSWLVYLFCLEIFNKEKQKELIGMLAVIAFNIFPGYFGIARMYMSEISQTFLVLVISYIALKQQQSRNAYWYFILGFFAAAAVLLRFIMPVYLIVPTIIFLYQQIKLKYSITEITKRVGLLLLGFLPLAASWYAQNLVAYWEFTRYTSFGPLAEITSLGPVWSPVTWLKFWNVIALWHFSWPWLLVVAVLALTALFIIIKKKLFKVNLKNLTQTQKILLLLFIIPLPAFVMATLSINKTARYFLPVEVFWIILGVYIFWQILLFVLTSISKKQLKYLFTAILLMGAFMSYPFMQSVISVLPELPRSSYLPSSGKPLGFDPSSELYNFAYSVLAQHIEATDTVYIIPEQVRFNDAQLQWTFAERGNQGVFIGEFSTYHTLEEGLAKVEKASLIVLDFNATVANGYEQKYEQLKEMVLASGEFEIIASQNFSNGAQMAVLKRISIYATE